MNVFLEVVEGPDSGRRITLKSGQIATFGRTEWSDFSFPEDGELEEVHFAIECHRTSCTVRDMDSRSGLQHNGQMSSSATCQDGDVIKAGKTTFAVTIKGEVPRMTDSTTVIREKELAPDEPDGVGSEVSGEPSEEKPTTTAKRTAALCQGVDFEEADSRQLVKQYEAPQDFVRELIERGYLVDAVRATAQWLPKREAVWWGRMCVLDATDDGLPTEENDALNRAADWVMDPSEENRRAAERAAVELDYQTAAAWIAGGAFWSGASLAPPDGPEIPPARTLTGIAIAAAVTWAAHESPHDTEGRYQEYLAWSRKIVGGEIHW